MTKKELAQKIFDVAVDYYNRPEIAVKAIAKILKKEDR